MPLTMLFFISQKKYIYSERVCKNALEKCICSDFFTAPQTEKIPSL